MSLIRVLLVDDHALVRAGLHRLLDEQLDVEVVGEAEDGESALRMLQESAPAVVLLDLNMPGISGIEVTRRIIAKYPEIKVIGLSMVTEEPFPTRMMEAGASGYLSKDAAADEVVKAIRHVFKGGHYLAPTIAGSQAASRARGDAENPFDTLSARETQVMGMLTRGKSTQEISDHLFLSPKTVSTYRSRLFEKLKVGNNVELTRMALRFGLLDDDFSGEAKLPAVDLSDNPDEDATGT